MTDFKASNGYRVERLSDGQTRIIRETRGAFEAVTWCGADEYLAIAEHSAHERDEALGRWRETSESLLVAYAMKEPGHIWIVDERTGDSIAFTRDLLDFDGTSPDAVLAARAYFAAHPEPKPWHDAKDGEAWVLTVNGAVDAWAFRIKEWERISDGYLLQGAPGSPAITNGYRLWPSP